MDTKYCRKCQQNKSVDEFYFDVKRNAHVAPCKTCRIAVVRTKNDAWKKANRQRYNDASAKAKIFRKYGLAWDALVSMWEAQDRSCAICHRPIAIRSGKKQKNIHVDHCHFSGVVRGLLCLTCNTGLGMFGDSVDLLEAARNYLLSREATTVKATDSTTVTVDSHLISTSIH